MSTVVRKTLRILCIAIAVGWPALFIIHFFMGNADTEWNSFGLFFGTIGLLFWILPVEIVVIFAYVLLTRKKQIVVIKYLVAFLLCLIPCLIQLSYYHSLKNKIIAVEQQLPEQGKQTIEFISRNFHNDRYLMQIAFLPSEPGIRSYDLPERFIDRIREKGRENEIHVLVQDSKGNNIADLSYNLSAFTIGIGFADRHLEGYVPLSPDSNGPKEWDERSHIQFSSGEEYHFKLSVSGLDPELAAMKPKLIFAGVDDGYFGIGYIIYPVFWLVAFAVIFVALILYDIFLKRKKTS